MTTPADIALAAGTAVACAMGTDGWTYVRERVAGFFRRHAPEEGADTLVRLDAYESAVAAAGPDLRERVADRFGPLVAHVLAEVAARSDEAAEAVRVLADEVRSASAENNSQSNVLRDINTGGGDFNLAGRSIHTHRGGHK
ncbi:hypothetical protein [Streptomyces sp. NPDC048442]|uniref:hypothetical protein n=1 Tax=Streptomyces sp. NPDC048442 TaxID=3154823 RepID=UPI003412BB2E